MSLITGGKKSEIITLEAGTRECFCHSDDGLKSEVTEHIKQTITPTDCDQNLIFKF